MRFAITSDLHFGSPDCLLVHGDRKNGFALGEKYERFREAVGTGLDFLILAGDVLDLSASDYEGAYASAREFFRRIKRDGVLRREGEKPDFGAVIYVAGNHDAEVWHIVQHERHVTKRIERGELPESYAHSVAGIIDDRRESPAYGFILDKTHPQAQGMKKYGGMFLDAITREPGQENGETPFYFAYPNLYIVTETGSALVTHGHCFEPFWTFGCEVATNVAYDDLPPGHYSSPRAVKQDIEEAAGMNFPLSQLSCAGIGQSGILTPVLRQVRDDVYSGRVDRLERYFDRLADYVISASDSRLLRSVIGRLLVRIGRDEALKAVGKVSRTRFNREFGKDPSAQKRFRRFFDSTLREIAQIVQVKRREPGCERYTLPAPNHVIFGHTHLPAGWNDPKDPPLTLAVNPGLRLHNTGGWIMDAGVFHGADVFLYESGKGFRSVPVR
jgi:predicted phosphodiesterase